MTAGAPTSLAGRVAGAPISWGVDGSPATGVQLPPARVLAEMAGLGLAATELGPDGWLPGDPAALRGALGRDGLRLVGAYVPVRLHLQLDAGARADLARQVATLAGAGAGRLVLAADAGPGPAGGGRDALDRAGWARLLANLAGVAGLAAGHGLATTLHPHVGTVVERPAEVEQVLDGSDVPLCLDTGHIALGGGDPVELARSVPERVGHVHLKDVDGRLAREVVAGRLPYPAAVRAGVYRPLGQGDLDIAAVVGHLEAAGYTGWYVLEQDVMLGAEPPPGRGPVEAVRASLAFMRALGR
jgi:inosose dehydratase